MRTLAASGLFAVPWKLGLLCLVLLAVLPGAWAETVKLRPGKPAASKRTRALAVPSVAHTVRQGETVWSIARRHGVTVEQLRSANQVPAAGSIRVGQRLAIPGGDLSPDRQEPPSPAEIVLGAPPEAPAVTLVWPVQGPVVSGFGPRGRAWHGGLDLGAERGTAIWAAAPGMVVTSGWERGYGNVVKIWHHHDLMTVYAHNQENRVRVGDWVERGQVVATVGSTGRTTAPHLHFEVRLAGQKYDPRFWLSEPGAVEVAVRPLDRPVR